MNNSRLNRTCTLQGCTSDMNTRDLTIGNAEDNKEEVRYSLDYDVSKSKDTSACQIQSKRLHKSENDSEVFTSTSKRIKVAQSFTFAEQEVLKPTNGTHEIQVSEGGEKDLHKHYNECVKNPGHTKFIPVNDFDINHLPEGQHDNDIVELIKATADLTVRVAVKMTSTERPKFWPETKKAYACYNMRGSDVMRLGTGTVRHVTKWTEEDIKKYNLGTCPCRKCQLSDTSSKVWGEVRMYTATHVVFDDLEARHTTCRLFFDRQDSPLVTLDGWIMVSADIKDDWCELKCVACDVDLLDKLDKMANHWINLWEGKKIKFKRSRHEVKLSFIVSHPHGRPKQISVGQWINRYVVNEDRSRTKYTYTTCTCPGSSGAYVYSQVYNNGWLYYVRHEHTGVDSKGNNKSGAGWDFQ